MKHNVYKTMKFFLKKASVNFTFWFSRNHNVKILAQFFTQEHVLHVSASKIKLLEAAEEMELVKRDRHGQMREFTVDQLEDFLPEGEPVEGRLIYFLIRMESILGCVKWFGQFRHLTWQLTVNSIPAIATIHSFCGSEFMLSCMAHMATIIISVTVPCLPVGRQCLNANSVLAHDMEQLAIFS